MQKVLLGIGSNLGSRLNNIHLVLKHISKIAKIENSSFLYKTSPLYNLNQEYYLNAAIQIGTNLSPEQLFLRLKNIEQTMGRDLSQKVYKGPRIIDIDILTYGDQVYESEKLKIPHIGIPERDFVLIPLMDMVPLQLHPEKKISFEKLATINAQQNTANISNPNKIMGFQIDQQTEKLWDFNEKTRAMGIINCTPDSFHVAHLNQTNNFEDAINQVKKFINAGFDIIDIGGESTRPNANEISLDEELSRVLPLIETIRKDEATKHIIISIDTRKAKVAEEAIKLGANIINDVSAGNHDSSMLDICVKYDIPIILMHMRGTPKTMMSQTNYGNLLEEMKEFFDERLKACQEKGIPKWNIILDPGIGFAKKGWQNYEIIQNLDFFKRVLGYPLLVGFSNKSFLKQSIGNSTENLRVGNAALSAICIQKGADILRLHDAETINAIHIGNTIYKKYKIL